MKRLFLLAIAPVVLLAACAEVSLKLDEARLMNGFNARLVTAPVPTRPNVFVVEPDSYAKPKVVVDQEPIVVHHGKVSIAWALQSDSPYTFPERNAIKIEGIAPEGFNCVLGGSSAKSVVCSYTTGEPVTIKYTITVKTSKGDVQSVDPHMDNW